MNLPRTHCWTRLLLLLVAPICSVLADEQDTKFAALPKGVQILTAGSAEQVRLANAFGAAEPVAVEGRAFSTAVRIRTEKRPPQTYSFQVRVPTSTAVQKGDRLLAVFDARTITPQLRDGTAETEFVFELGSAPYTKSVSQHVIIGTVWRRFYIPFEALADYPAGKGAVILRAGYDPQTIEIGGIQALDYGPDFPLVKLPVTPATYVGRETDAPWRKAAAEQIERIRKADLTVTVTDNQGQPVPDAKVFVRMKRQAFGWGTAVDARTLFAQGPDGDRYREIIPRLFNKAVLENDLKWGAWEADPQRALQAVAWLHEHSLAVRGHVLLWPGKTNLPGKVIDLLGRPDELRQTVLAHVTEEAKALRGQVVEWDVVNEPGPNFDIQTALSGVERYSAPDWIERHASTLAPFFTAAQVADPGAKLDINDYSILETGGKDAAHQEHYERTIRQLLADRAPLQGIGIQGHFSEDLTPIPRLWEILDRFGAFGLPIQITEFDVNSYDEALQADYTRDFLTAMFAHEQVSGVLVWGYWEKRHWIPNAAFYRADWSLRPAGQVWMDLVQNQWSTNAETVTDARGQCKVRGFLGEYEIVAQLGQQSATMPATLSKGGTGVKLSLP